MHHPHGLESHVLAWLDAGSFQPHGAMLDEAGRGELIAGVGRRREKPVVVFASRPGPTRSAIGVPELERICWALEQGRRRMWPVVGLLNSSGARVSEGLSLVGTGAEMVGRLAVIAESEAPLVIGIDEACVGLAGLIAANADYCLMTEGSWLALAGPGVVQAGLGGPKLTPEELGGHEVHCRSGMVHSTVADVSALLDRVDDVLAYLSAHQSNPSEPEPSPPITDLVPESPRELFDMGSVVAAIVDAGSLVEYAPEFGVSQIAGFARINGMPLGVLASNPLAKAGALDTDACRKSTRFVDLVAKAGLPLVQLIDTPGGMPDAVENAKGLMREYMGLIHALYRLRTMRITVVVRRLYGGALSMTGHWRWHGDLVYAWPQANLGLMGPAAASAIRRDMGSDVAQAALEAHHRDLSNAGRNGLIDDVITPGSTRKRLTTLLESYYDLGAPRRWDP